VDIDFSDGTITFNGKNTSVFIQPGALSFGWGSSLSSNKSNVVSINHTVVDFDVIGPNALSLKVSHVEGNQTVIKDDFIQGTKVQLKGEDTIEVEISIHRWPRILATAMSVYVLFQTGALQVVRVGGTALVEGIIYAVQQLSRFLQQVPVH
jgi:hypothetical protein